ncbi:MAG: hypothetical protein M1436_09775 [Acidobacteria bacterium]|nr:hypothetical protein [Acidobacteriota bacterium]
MPSYQGKFQYGEQAGACQFRFDEETCILAPAGGAPLAFDLGDVDSLQGGEWDLQLELYTGRVVRLQQFGSAFSRMREELTRAWRDRTVRCMLLEDLEEVGRWSAHIGMAPHPPGPVELRLYRSNLAVLPSAGVPFQWRLAEVDTFSFSPPSYTFWLDSGAQHLSIGKLGKLTDDFGGKLQGALDHLRTQSAEALHRVFPFLDPDRLAQLTTAMPEGRSVPLSTLAGIDARLPEALVARAVGAHLKPYFEALRARALAGSLLAGFKFIRREEGDAEQAGEEAAPEEQPGEPVEPEQAQEERPGQDPLFFWFFFPLPGNVVAWEAGTGSGRATYFFRVTPPVEESVAQITRGLALVNFRREPVYLSDEVLERQPRFRRYAIGRRRLPDLRALRNSFIARAAHTSAEAWTAQVRNTLGILP